MTDSRHIASLSVACYLIGVQCGTTLNRSQTMTANDIRQMMLDWDRATPEQRAEALRIASASAQRAAR